MKTLKQLFCIASLIAISLTGNGQAKIEGKWYGKLVISPRFQLTIAFDVFRGSDGKLYGYNHSVDQQTFNIELDKITTTTDSVTLEIGTLNAIYSGKFIANDSLIGHLAQGKGKPFMLNMKKVDEYPFTIAKRPQEPVKPYSYFAEDVTFKNGDIELKGTFTRPNAKGKYPTVVLISGSGPSDRNQTIFGHKTFLVLADLLTRSGIAVLRYDDRGAGKSSGNFFTATLVDHAKDASEAVNYLLSREDVNTDNVGVIGHSLGAEITAIAANYNPNIKHIVLMSGAGNTLENGIYEQTRAIYNQMGASKEGIDLNEDILRAVIQTYKSSANDSLMKINVKAVLETFNTKVAAISEKDQELLELSVPLNIRNFGKLLNPFMRYDLFHNPCDELSKVTIPVFAINGDKDVQVFPQNLALIDSALKKSQSKNFKIKLYPNKNHLFQECTKCTVDEYYELEQTISEDVIADLVLWIKGQ